MRDCPAAGEGWVRVVSQDPMYRSKARISHYFGRAALLALSLGAFAAQAAALACSKEAPAAVEPESKVAASRAPATEAPAAASAAEAPAAAPAGEAEPGGALPAADKKFSEVSFDLEIKPKGNYTVGQGAELEVVLAAKDPYHVNDKYPFKLKLEDTDGITYADKVVKKDAVKLEAKRAVMTVKFTPASKGKKHIAGQFAFSICTAERCLIEKRDLALDVNVN